jgi:hypothetical protein
MIQNIMIVYCPDGNFITAKLSPALLCPHTIYVFHNYQSTISHILHFQSNTLSEIRLLQGFFTNTYNNDLLQGFYTL